ncbi:MAG: hypothetical protein ACW98X_00020 [Promethearchaeota archaeon]
MEHIKSLIMVGECEFLDFKFDMYNIFHNNNNARILNRQEFLRDVLSLVNIKRTEKVFKKSYLIIGLDENNENYNGNHIHIDFNDFLTLTHIIQTYISPSLTAEIEEFFIMGDAKNILLSKSPVSNYDRVIMIIFTHKIGDVYEIKKEYGNKGVGFLRVGESYTRDGSSKRRITESDRIIIRSLKNIDLTLKFKEGNQKFEIIKNIKAIHSSGLFDTKLDLIKESLMDRLFKVYESLPKSAMEDYKFSVNSYIEELKGFLIIRNNYFNELNKIISFELELVNQGTEKAKDIDVFITTREDMQFIKELPDKPENIPKIPSLSIPNSLNNLMNIGRILSSAIPNDIFTSLSPSIYQMKSKNYTEIENNNLRVHLNELKQDFLYNIDTSYIKLDSMTNRNEIKLKYIIIIGEPSQTLKGELTLIVEKQMKGVE